MRRVERNTGAALLECINPVKGRWRARWDVREHENSSVSYVEKESGHKPTDEEIRPVVTGWYDGQTNTVTLPGLSCNGVPVWLSGENQFSHKSAYDLAMRTSSDTLPAMFRFGTDAQLHYYTLGTLEELAGLYTAAMKHIRSTLAEGWRKKDSFGLGLYRVEQLEDVSLRGRSRKKPPAC